MNTDAVEKKRSRLSSYEFRPVHAPDEWRSTLGLFDDPHVLQSWVWGAFKSRWGWTATRLALLDLTGQEEPNAAAMILKRRVPRLPITVLYVPRGPIFDYSDPDLRLTVLSKLEEWARQEGAVFIKIDPEVVRAVGAETKELDPVGEALVGDLTARGWRFSNDQIQFRNTVLLNLDADEETILAEMKQKTRYNIRLAGRRDVCVRQGTTADFNLIADMYVETAGRDEFAIRPRDYYLDAWQTLYDAGLLMPFIAEYQGEPLGMVLIVRSGRRAIYMYGASRDKERKRMPNYLLQWEAIRWAKAVGCREYDFWGAPDDFVETDRLWGVWRFKSGFNGQVVRHIGAWDYPTRPFMYWLYTVILPKYLAYLRRR
jgi:lipid II:glycine glycyltransferase (peptidoglycan interpeptide bridge formation enzyme)